VLRLSLTARDLLQKLANDAGLPYQTIARKVNRMMAKGKGLLESVRDIAGEHGLKGTKYRIDADKIVREAEKILREDYTQTLMISAVLGQMVEARGRERLPAPAFFAFIEMLSKIPDAPRDTKSETSTEIEDRTTRIIELMTTLVSVLCEWSEKGIVGVDENCPESLRDMAKVVFRKTKLLQGGLWTCISCGNIVNVKETRALMCATCDSSISRSDIHQRFDQMAGRNRTSYGRTTSEENDD
jgi:DNA-binding Lrp family transcriptional regulator